MNKQVQCDRVILLSSALIALNYLSSKEKSMRMNIYVNHFSNFYFPNMDLKNSTVHYPDLLFLMHIESTYKTVLKTSPTKCALVVLFITFASCKHSKIPPFRFQSQGFRWRRCPVHPKPSQHPCAQNWSTTTLQVPYPQWRLDKKLCSPQPITADPATWQPSCSAHMLWQS